MGGFSLTHWIILLVVVVLVFGTKKLKNLGTDLGGAIKGFKEAMDEGKTDKAPDQLANDKSTIDVKAEKVEEKS